MWTTSVLLSLCLSAPTVTLCQQIIVYRTLVKFVVVILQRHLSGSNTVLNLHTWLSYFLTSLGEILYGTAGGTVQGDSEITPPPPQIFWIFRSTRIKFVKEDVHKNLISGCAVKIGTMNAMVNLNAKRLSTLSKFIVRFLSSSVRHLHTVLVAICEFRENRSSQGHKRGC